jgi:hypothetical protein
MGLLKLIGGIWFVYLNHASITPEVLMKPEGFVPALAVISGLNDVLFVGDAKDEKKARDITPDTTVVVERGE